MQVHTADRQTALPIVKTQVDRLVQSFLRWKKIKWEEVVVHLVDKEEITALHGKYFCDPTPTDCISFPIDDPNEIANPYLLLGEVFVCPRVAIEYARVHDKNPYTETSLYLIHSLLHLLGYDDRDERSRSMMHVQEKSAMVYLAENKELLHAV